MITHAMSLRQKEINNQKNKNETNKKEIKSEFSDINQRCSRFEPKSSVFEKLWRHPSEQIVSFYLTFSLLIILQINKVSSTDSNSFKPGNGCIFFSKS